jgi:hypothetical protein
MDLFQTDIFEFIKKWAFKENTLSVLPGACQIYQGKFCAQFTNFESRKTPNIFHIQYFTLTSSENQHYIPRILSVTNFEISSFAEMFLQETLKTALFVLLSFVFRLIKQEIYLHQ